MSDLLGMSRDSLQAAQGDLAKARRGLPLAAGLLALVHLLTVHPYVETAREIAVVQADMAANRALVAGIAPGLERLEQTAARAGGALQDLLADTTQAMVARFAVLRDLTGRALEGEPPPPLPDEVLLAGGATMPMAQMPLPDMMQQQMQQVGPDPRPIPNMLRPPEPLPGLARPEGGELAAILAALADRRSDAMDRLTAFAREHIVAEAYAGARAAWEGRIRPDFLAALDGAAQAAEDAAARAGPVDPRIATALADAAAALGRQRAALGAVAIAHDADVDAALGGEWWRTVQGKGAFADALVASVEEQMRAIMGVAQGPAEAIRASIALQQELHDSLAKRQEELARQFAEHREQLATLSGTAGAIPADLRSFIGLFPLVIGIVLGALLLRGGQARRQAALAAEGYVRAAPGDVETRAWLVRGALGGTPAGCLAAGVSLAAAAVAWIALAAWQVSASPEPPPLAPWLSGVLGAALVIAATAWDLAAARRLAALARA